MNQHMIDYDSIEKELFAQATSLMKWGRVTWETLPKDLKKSLSSRVQKHSDAFTRHRESRKQDYFAQDLDVAAYLLHFHTSSMARTLACLQQLPTHITFPSTLHVLDVGCGTGAATEALIRWMNTHHPHVKLEVTLVDISRRVLSCARQRLSKLASVTLQVHHGTIEDIQDKYDIILAAHVFNENEAQTTALCVVERLNRHGCLLLLEPALIDPTRSLMSFKNELVAEGLCTWAPCTHDHACPMLNEPKQWCHFDVPWSPGPIRTYFDQSMNHDTTRLSFAYLLMGRKPHQTDAGRVVSHVLKSTFKKTSLIKVCCEASVQDWYFPKKHPLFVQQSKGDLVDIPVTRKHFDRLPQENNAFWVGDAKEGV